MKSFIILLCIIGNGSFLTVLKLLPSGEPSAQAETVDFPDLYYEIQIAEINSRTSLELYYDETVQEYIDSFLTSRRDDYIEFYKRSEKFFPLFEKYLSHHGLPAEIKYLAVLESGLSPVACSPSNAIGLWQFKMETARNFGLRIDGNRDDRTNPELSTEAACLYLKFLYERFQDWDLSLIAYNAGPGTLNSAIKKNSDNSDYFSLLPYLPLQAQRYLPALTAIIYLFENYDTHI